MTKAVRNRKICFIKAVLLLCEHGHVKKTMKIVFLPPPPNTIRVNVLLFQEPNYNLPSFVQPDTFPIVQVGGHGATKAVDILYCIPRK